MKIHLDFNRIIGYFINRDERFLAIKSERDWRVLIVCYFVVLFVVLTMGGYLFWKIQFSDPLTSLSFESEIEFTKEEESFVLKKDLLESLLNEMSEKGKNFSENLEKPPAIEDPSL